MRTPKGELYMALTVMDGTTVLAYGDNGTEHKLPTPQALAWVKEKDGLNCMPPRWDITTKLYQQKEFLGYGG